MYTKIAIWAHIFYDGRNESHITRIVINENDTCPVNQRIDGLAENYLTAKEVHNGKNEKWLQSQIKKMHKFHSEFKPIKL